MNKHKNQNYLEDGSISLSQFGKDTEIGYKKIFKVLAEKKIIFKNTNDEWTPSLDYLDSKIFKIVETEVYKHGKHNDPEIYNRIFVTPAGVVALRLILGLSPFKTKPIKIGDYL